MTEYKVFRNVRDSFLDGESIVFAAPVSVIGGSKLFVGKITALAQLKGEMLSFADDDPYFKDGPRMILLSSIYNEQLVVVKE